MGEFRLLLLLEFGSHYYFIFIFFNSLRPEKKYFRLPEKHLKKKEIKMIFMSIYVRFGIGATIRISQN